MTGPVSIQISLEEQKLYLLDAGDLAAVYPISTAKNGPGEQQGSECTPRGRHVVRARIGAGQPAGSVFVARRPTGELFDSAMLQAFPERDWILSRILWLSGVEPGRNRLGPVDTMRRYIYIHGSPDQAPIGVPGSHGCVRMRNDDIIELFDKTPIGCEVLIVEGAAGL